MTDDLHPIPDGFEQVSPEEAGFETGRAPRVVKPPTPELRAREPKPSKEDPREKLYDIPDGFEIVEPEHPSAIQAATEAARRGLVHGLESAQAGAEILGDQSFKGVTPPTPDRSQIGILRSKPLSEGWRDPAWWAAKLSGDLTEGAPTLAMGAAGGAIGGLPGGAAGLGLGAALQALQSSYQNARAQGASHDDATTQAIFESGISGLGGAATGLAPGVSIFGKNAAGVLRRPVGEGLAQLFGVQPGIMAGQQAAQNAVAGQPIGEGVPEAAIMGAAQGIPIVGAHAAAPLAAKLGPLLTDALTRTIPAPPPAGARPGPIPGPTPGPTPGAGTTTPPPGAGPRPNGWPGGTGTWGQAPGAGPQPGAQGPRPNAPPPPGGGAGPQPGPQPGMGGAPPGAGPRQPGPQPGPQAAPSPPRPRPAGEPSFVGKLAPDQQAAWDASPKENEKKLALGLGARLDVMRANPDANPVHLANLEQKLASIVSYIMGESEKVRPQSRADRAKRAQEEADISRQEAERRAQTAKEAQAKADQDAADRAAREAERQAASAQNEAETNNETPKTEQPATEKFIPESGTLGVPRAEMPQVKSEHHGALTNFLGAKGISHRTAKIPAAWLKPIQDEYSPEKVARAKEEGNGGRSIIVSSDGHVIDGHHQAMAAAEKGEDVKAIVLDAPAKEALEAVKAFPSAKTTEATAPETGHGQIVAEPVAAPEPTPEAPKPESVGATQAEAAPVDVKDWAATRLAGLLGHQRSASHDQMAGMILEAARTGKLNDIVRPDNKNSRKVFEEVTGVKLPRTVKGTVQALKDGAPFNVSVPGAKTAPKAEEPKPAPESVIPPESQPAKVTPPAELPMRPATKGEIYKAKADKFEREQEALRISPEAQRAALKHADEAGITDEILDKIGKDMSPEEAADSLWLDDAFWEKHPDFEWSQKGDWRGADEGFHSFVENVARAKGVPLDDPKRLDRWRDHWAMRDLPDLLTPEVVEKFAAETIKSILADPEQKAAVEAVAPEISNGVEGQATPGEAGTGDQGAEHPRPESPDAGAASGDNDQRAEPPRARENAPDRGDDAGAEADSAAENPSSPSKKRGRKPIIKTEAEGTDNGRPTAPAGNVGETGEPKARPGVADGVPSGAGASDVLASGTAENGRAPGRDSYEDAGARPSGQGTESASGLSESGLPTNGREGTGRKGLADKGAGKSTGRKGPRDPRPAATRPDFHIADPDALIGGTPKVRFARNKAAIETYRTLQEEARDPTAEELDALGRYIGWGSFGQELFQGNWGWKRPKDGWDKEDEWLRNHLGQDEWESAQRSIINAHYTDPPTVQTMWRMVERMGFKNGRVLEPSMGIGNFFGLMPLEMASKSDRTGIELDQLTGGMAKILYPNANVSIKGYQDSATPDNFYDLVIGNWPFAKDGPADRRYASLSPSLHDYFFLKGLDQVRPGGIVIGITSAGTMDKVGRATRIELAKKGELLGAFRLPSGAFEKYAGTSVVTDIVVLRKREKPQAAANEPWIDTVEVDTPAGEKIKVNRYFADNPSHVLGTLNFGSGSTYGRPSMIVDRPADLMERLAKLPDLVPADAYQPITRGNEPRFITNNTKDREGSVIHKDGGLYQVQGERLAALEDIGRYKVKDAKKTAAREDEIKRLVEIRQAYGKLLDADRAGAENADELRADLKAKYDAFRKAHKTTIADSNALRVLWRVDDPFAPSLEALEREDGTPSAIFTERTMRAPRSVDNPSVREAFVIARNESRGLDINRVAELSKTPVDDVLGELLGSKAIYRTPGDGYEVSDVYLSGNVRRKLREAQDAQTRGEDMDDSIEALKKVIPKDTPYFEIEAKLGAGWVPNDDYRAFINNLLGVENGDMEITFMNGSWKVKFEDRGLNHRPEATTQWGHEDYKFDKLLTSAFNSQSIKIYTKDDDGKPVLDDGASKEATEKATRVREEFSSWIWKDSERKVRLEQSYNEVNNAVAEATWDGSFLDFQGMALRRGDDPFSMRQHQVNAVWRGLANKRGLYAHEVGTGKTYTMGALAVESRRYGISRKPLVLAHNANSASVAREMQEQYPGAKILYVENMSAETVKTTVARIANDDWDAVVIPHSLIDRIALSKETLMEIAQEQIAALEQEALSAAEEDGAPLDLETMSDPEAMKKVRSVTAKQLVHQRNKIIQSIEKLANRASRPDAIKLEDTGVDMIIVDEAHEFKKPPIATKMQLRGLNKGTSDRSIALQFITSYVKKMNGGSGVHLFTGTPITNTLTEIFNMQRFIMDDQMKLDNLADWDTWFNTFADSTSDVELTSTGEYEPVTRLAAFVNVAELRRMIGQYMDIVFADDMPEFKPRETSTGKTLNDKLTDSERDELLNGRTEKPIGRPYKKIINDVAPLGQAQDAVLKMLVDRAHVFKQASRKERRDMSLRGAPEVPIRVENDATNASLDVRLFQIDARDEPQSKVNRAVKNVSELYHSEPLATQVIFMQIGYSDHGMKTVGEGDEKTKIKVPRFNLSKDLVRKLEAAGIPDDQIRIVDGSVSKEERMQIADMMNEGKVRVVIGQTGTLGIGVNMQRNLRAIHHMDAPWMPGDLEQRNGRGQRQGNKWNTVLEYRYISEGLDGRRWQVLAVKDRFIKAFLKADKDVRIIDGDAVSDEEGESDIALTLAEAAGDPRLLMVNKLKADITKLQNRERLHAYGIHDAGQVEKRLKDQVSQMIDMAANKRKDLEKWQTIKEGTFSAKIDGKTFDKRADAGEALDAHLKTLPDVGHRWTQAGVEVQGFSTQYRMGMITGNPVFAIKFAGETHEIYKPTLGSIEGTLRQIPDSLEKLGEKIEDTKRSAARMAEAQKQPFQQAATLEKKRKMLKDTESDLETNPVPPPQWLRIGAPVGTLVYVDGRPRTVEGHRWDFEGYFVLTDKGPVPYLEASDETGVPLYEEREFKEPVIGKKRD